MVVYARDSVHFVDSAIRGQCISGTLQFGDMLRNCFGGVKQLRYVSPNCTHPSPHVSGNVKARERRLRTL